MPKLEWYHQRVKHWLVRIFARGLGRGSLINLVMAEGRRKRMALEEQGRRLRARSQERGRRERQLLNVIMLLAVALVGVCVYKFIEKERIIAQLESSLAEKEQIIIRLQSSLTEKGRNIIQLQSYSTEEERIITHPQTVSEKESVSSRLRRSCPTTSCTCHVSGPGLSATANYPTHVIVELSDASGQPCSLRQNVTAELQSVDQSSVVPTTVSVRSPSQYEVSYTTLNRGQHKLHVRLNGSEVSGSPFSITVYPDPTQLRTPVRLIEKLKAPWGISINSHGEMVVSNCWGHTVSRLNRGGKEIQTYGSDGYRPDQMKYPRGVAIDSDDNVYVASQHKLQKFSRDGHLIKCVGQYGNEDEEFREPKGVRLHHGFVYVCDWYNHHIQVFDTDLKFVKTIGSFGSSRGNFNEPYDLDFDNEGNAYIADCVNNRIQVIDTSGQFVRQFGQEKGEGKLKEPSAVHVMGQFVYVSDQGHDCIAVYQTSGQFVTSFGHLGKGEGEFNEPYDITSDQNGFVYIVDFNNHRVQIF